MNPDDLEQRMRELEYFHGLRVLPGTWPVLRLDGRSFSRLTETQFEKPFDLRFHELMCKTTEVLVTESASAVVQLDTPSVGTNLMPRQIIEVPTNLRSVSKNSGDSGLIFSPNKY